MCIRDRVKSGETVITISNTTTMVVEITVDDRNISFINQGMTVELTDYNQNVFMGTVTSINMGGAESKNGMTTYPVTLEVDNSAGTLYDGAWLDYSFVTSEADNCIVVPSQAVIYVSDTEGNQMCIRDSPGLGRPGRRRLPSVPDSHGTAPSDRRRRWSPASGPGR